ncbi:MAG: hypothetical protein JSU91_06875 [Thermoplasmatales archaeon]|jgi:uncharacterized protein involved in tolerance to divalent cations|nr:MAG: hypothetical protein JSU91_06875 [Thermoplasmatales archaeon]
METYIDVYISSDGEKSSEILKKLVEMGLKPSIGNHDFIFDWKGIVSIEEEIKFIDKIQDKLKGTGVILKFKTNR